MRGIAFKNLGEVRFIAPLKEIAITWDYIIKRLGAGKLAQSRPRPAAHFHQTSAAYHPDSIPSSIPL
jgi:hypothetical protein